jgi:hypothetical protein
MVPPQQLEEIPAMFKNNAGETGEVFTGENPMFTVDGAFTEAAQKLFGYKPPVDPQKFARNLEQYEQLIEDRNYKLRHTDNLSGGFVFVHNKADKVGLTDNIKAARKLSTQLGDGVVIREHLGTGRNPEFEINGITSDLKTPAGKESGIKYRFRSARKQGLDNLVLELDGYSIEAATEGLKRGFRNHSVNEVRVIFSGKVVMVTRADYEKGIIEQLIREGLK